MVEGILGIKRGMTQVFDENGRRTAVTVIEAGPCRVTQIKTRDKEGYEAVQLGFGEKKHSRRNKPLGGHAQKAGVSVPQVIREFALAGEEIPQLGQQVDVSLFQEGELVDISGITKGRGFQGTVKRHGFSRGPMTHGSRNQREPGSIGCVRPGRVIKGKKLPGHMGVKRRTVQRLKVVSVDPEKNMLVVKGAVPGARNGYLEIRKTKKPRK